MPEYGREAMNVRGASRASFAALTEQLAAEGISSATVATRLGNELFAVVGLLDTEHGLRRALSDPGKPVAEKAAVASALLHGKVTGRTEALVVAAVESRWATSGDMVDAIEQLAIEALVLTAEAENGLDDLEDGLFRFGRVVAAQPVLRAAVELTAAQRRRLADTLAATYGHRVHLNIVIDPAVVGGISVQIGDELIDGTAARRLAAVRRKLAG